MKQQLGHYDIVAELGRGGMGVVYKGYEGSLNRYVAIKVLADALAHDAAVKERFLREARSMAALNDPHIIQIYFIGDDAGQTYFVMEFVDGESLSSILKREGLLQPEQAARIVYQTALGLATAHDRGVIHRDIKPGNIMITSRGNVKIADFGIALSSQDISKKLTSTGEFVGTPGYLSPEVCLGKPVDQRSDIFSLGIVLFEMLAGRMPFTEESPLGLMLEVVKAEIPDVCKLNSQVDPELARVLSRMIAKEPADRYQSCHELAADLGRHPLLAAGGTLKLQTQQSTAAATVIGMKTPVSGQSALPSTTPTPQPLPRSTPASLSADAATRMTPSAQPLPAAMPAAAVHEPVLQRPSAQAKSSSPAVPLAIAAAALLAVGAGAWAFRDQIPFLKQMTTTQVAQTQTTTTTTPSTVAATTAPATTTAAATPVTTATPTTNTAAAGDPNATAANAAAQTAANTTSPPITTTAPTEPTSTASNTAANQSLPVSALVDNGGPAPRASQVEPLKQLAAAQAANVTATAPAATQQIAHANPPQPVAPPRPHEPTITIIASGDANIVEPAVRALTAELVRHGYHVIHGGGAGGERRAALANLARSGTADAAVFVHARPIGAEQLQYYGQSSTVYNAQLSVNAFAVQSGRALGAGWSEQVRYGSINATEQVKEAVSEMPAQIERELTEFRPGHTRG
jgi:serine/threonine-protein kinase